MALEDQSAVVRSTGKVNWFDDSKGFGFINPDEGEEELFVHQSSIVSEGFRSLKSGESVEFSVTKGNNGKTQAVDVTAPGGAPIPKKEKENGRNGGRRGGCFNCGEVGHIAKDCDEEPAGCYDCGDIGHIARDCNKKLGGNGGGDRGAGKSKGCYTCGEIDHFARDCDQKLRENVGSRRNGGGGGCYACGGVGHMARDCVSQRQSGGCYTCGGTGHIARDCDRKGRSGGGGNNKCFSCGKEGHFARECPVA